MKAFGTTIEETASAFRGKFGSSAEDPQDEKRKAIVRIVVSFIVLAAGIYLVMMGSGERQQIGTGLVGIITGYWLK